MTIDRLSLADFRSYGEALIEPSPGLNILTGENGAGKTNLLEALSLLAPGRGLRGAAMSDMARQGGAGGFAVAARLGEIDIGTGARPESPERRLVRINGAAASANALAERVAAIWLTPAMDRLFAGSAGDRRRFLDRLVLAFDPAHAGHAARYEAAMRQRNRLLASETAPDRDWLTALEAQMARHGEAIVEARESAVRALSDRLKAAPAGPFARARIALQGWRPEGDFAAQLAQERRRDAAAGRTLSGPHRSDLAVAHLESGQAAALCSTGEQKALLLSIVLAHAELVAARNGAQPLLLLDEVAAHLDPRRRAALFERLGAQGGQVWLTGTEPALFEAAAGARMFSVVAGRIEG